MDWCDMNTNHYHFLLKYCFCYKLCVIRKVCSQITWWQYLVCHFESKILYRFWHFKHQNDPVQCKVNAPLPVTMCYSGIICKFLKCQKLYYLLWNLSYIFVHWISLHWNSIFILNGWIFCVSKTCITLQCGVICYIHVYYWGIGTNKN